MKKRNKENKDVKIPALAELLSDLSTSQELEDAILCAMSEEDFRATETLMPELVYNFEQSSIRKREDFVVSSRKRKQMSGYKSFNELLFNVQNQVKGKLSESKRILRDGYEYFSRKQQIAIIKTFLPSETKGDAWFVFSNMDANWSDEFINDIMGQLMSQGQIAELDQRYAKGEISKDDFEKTLSRQNYFLSLMAKYFPEEMVRNNIEQISDHSISYLHLCKRFGKSDWFHFSPNKLGYNVPVLRYFEAFNVVGEQIDECVAESIYYQIIAVFMNEYLNPGIEFKRMVDLRYLDFPYENYLSDLLFKIEVSLARMENIELLKKLCSWQTEVMLDEIFIDGELVSNSFFLRIFDCFPEQYKYLLDDKQFETRNYIKSGKIVLNATNAKVEVYPNPESPCDIFRKSITKENLTLENLSRIPPISNHLGNYPF